MNSPYPVSLNSKRGIRPCYVFFFQLELPLPSRMYISLSIVSKLYIFIDMCPVYVQQALQHVSIEQTCVVLK